MSRLGDDMRAAHRLDMGAAYYNIGPVCAAILIGYLLWRLFL